MRTLNCLELREIVHVASSSLGRPAFSAFCRRNKAIVGLKRLNTSEGVDDQSISGRYSFGFRMELDKRAVPFSYNSSRALFLNVTHLSLQNKHLQWTVHDTVNFLIMEIHEAFAEWVSEKGIEINGIAAHTFEGRGVGIIAEKRHAVCLKGLICYLLIVMLLSFTFFVSFLLLLVVGLCSF